MHLGLNSDVNKQTQITGIKHNLGESRVKLLSRKAPRVKNKHTETQPTREDLSVTKKPEIATKQSEAQNKGQSAASKKTKAPPSHESNLAVMTVLAGAFGYLLFKT